MEFHRSPLEKLTLTSKTVHLDEPRTADTMTSAPVVTKPSKAAAVGVVDTKLQSSVLSIDLETAALGKYIDEMLKNVPPGLRLRPTPKHDVDEPMEEKAESTYRHFRKCPIDLPMREEPTRIDNWKADGPGGDWEWDCLSDFLGTPYFYETVKKEEKAGAEEVVLLQPEELPEDAEDTFMQLLKENAFETAGRVACALLHKAEDNDRRQARAQRLLYILHEQKEPEEQLPQSYHTLREELRRAMMPEHRGESPEEREPKTIQEAYEKCDWAAMRKLYEAEKDRLSKDQLNKVILMAAWTSSWKVFRDCVERGADLVTPRRPGKGLQEQGRSDSLKAGKRGGTAKPSQARWTRTSTKLSPLHEAIKTGQFRLKLVEDAFEADAELANAVDHRGEALLHLAAVHGDDETRAENVRLLLKHEADVEAEDAGGRPVLQLLVGRGYNNDGTDVGLVVEVVQAAERLGEKSWRAGEHGWSALHLLCASGAHQHILEFVRKGAEPEELRLELTLIDTVVLQDCMPVRVKQQTLAVLLSEPIRLGPFHAAVVRERASERKRRGYRHHMGLGRDYVYPLRRLLFPLISIRAVRRANLELMRMLVEGGAVCDEELRALGPALATVTEDEIVQYLRPRVAEPAARSAVEDGEDILETASTLDKRRG